MQKVRRHPPLDPKDRGRAPTACRHPVSGSVSPPLSGCFSPFPHGTGALSVVEEYLGLEGGPPMFGQGFTCPALLEDSCRFLPVRGCHPLWPAFPDGSGSYDRATGLVRVRSPLLTESRLMSFPPATEMFQFAGFASRTYGFSTGYRYKRWVAPFGDPRIKERSPLPGAYRSVPRPSSPLDAKASTRCPSFTHTHHPAPAGRPSNVRDQMSEIRFRKRDSPSFALTSDIRHWHRYLRSAALKRAAYPCCRTCPHDDDPKARRPGNRHRREHARVH